MGGYYPTYINNNAQDVKGIDVKLTHRNHIGKDFQYGVTVNMTWAKDRWLRYQDSPNTPDYAKRTGKSRYMTMGFMTDGLFQSEEEIDNSPWISGSRPRVGDIKYKDLNGDGAITYDQDRAYLAAASVRSSTAVSISMLRGKDLNSIFCLSGLPFATFR